jgi:hypothetical protein
MSKEKKEDESENSNEEPGGKVQFHALVQVSGEGPKVMEMVRTFSSPKRSDLLKMISEYPPEQIIFVFKGKFLPLKQKLSYEI